MARYNNVIHVTIAILMTVLQYSECQTTSLGCFCRGEFEKQVRIYFASNIDRHSSCAEIRAARPLSPSGVYTLNYEDQTSEEVYCFMGTLPGCGEGGWRRIGYLNMTQLDQTCPSTLTTFDEGGLAVCSFPGGAGCASVIFSTNGRSYTRVCGSVRGYSIGSPDAFAKFGAPANDIELPYVDGVSITHGRNPRRHLWTYAASQLSQHGVIECPCTGDSTVVQPPSFVGDDYYCEAGGGVDNPLWDGEQCNAIETSGGCCAIPELPWFHRVIPAATDDIEMRLCRDEPMVGFEHIPVDQYQFYVQ